MAATTGLNLFDPMLGGASTRVVSASTTKAGAIYFTNKQIVVRKIGFVCSAISASPVLNAAIKTVSSSLPTVTDWASNTNVSVTPAANVWAWNTLTADATITAGSAFAAIVEYTSGTSGTVVYTFGGIGNNTGNNLPYPVVMASGTWAAGLGFPMICVQLSDGTILRGGLPIQQVTSNTFQSGTNPNERALVFTVPFACTIIGFRLGLGVPGATAAFTVNLYSGTGQSVMSGGTVTVPAGVVASNVSGLPLTLYFDAPIALTPGQYRLSVKATAAVNVILNKMTYLSTAERDMVMGEATEDTRNGSSWIGETTTTSPQIYPIFGSVTGGGAGVLNSGIIGR